MADIDRNELVRFKFSAQQMESELEWEHSKEFEYQGQMYDVVHHEELGDSTVFWCWWDHEETKLNQQLLTMTNKAFGNDPLKKERETQVITFIKSLYAQKKMVWKPAVSACEVQNHTAVQPVFYSLKITPPTPPPNLG